MTKNEIKLNDGRKLIFFSFDSSKNKNDSETPLIVNDSQETARKKE